MSLESRVSVCVCNYEIRKFRMESIFEITIIHAFISCFFVVAGTASCASKEKLALLLIIRSYLLLEYIKINVNDMSFKGHTFTVAL